MAQERLSVMLRLMAILPILPILFISTATFADEKLRSIPSVCGDVSEEIMRLFNEHKELHKLDAVKEARTTQNPILAQQIIRSSLLK